eukprot:8986433-Heterocapsa_arctica.AAC.1
MSVAGLSRTSLTWQKSQKRSRSRFSAYLRIASQGAGNSSKQMVKVTSTNMPRLATSCKEFEMRSLNSLPRPSVEGNTTTCSPE